MKTQEKSASDRKREHIELAGRSQMAEWSNDRRFYYEPLLSSHIRTEPLNLNFLGSNLKFPLWVSSMTGGTDQARMINENLASACKEFGLGMGLGSCRILLEEPDLHLADFALRKKMGPDQPLFANLGIAQLEKVSREGNWTGIQRMLEMLEATGLIIHVNPLQEWLQPEGDRFQKRPLDIVKEVLENISCPIIVKEVGQGMGPQSLKALMELPVVVEFGAYGGTNFAQLEINRSENAKQETYGELSKQGHNATEMIGFVNKIVAANPDQKCLGFIISGGIKNFLDGYYAINRIQGKAVYGQASVLLKYAMKSERELFEYIEGQIAGYTLASQYLKVREEE